MTQENYDDARKGVWFSIEIEEDEFLAFVSDDALRVHFEASRTKESQLAAFNENRKRIVSLARRRFLDGAVRPIKLRAADFDAAPSLVVKTHAVG
jgi:hypothetical protein